MADWGKKDVYAASYMFNRTKAYIAAIEKAAHK